MINPIIYPSACEFWLNPTLSSQFSDLSARKWKTVKLPREYTCNPSNVLASSIAGELNLNLPVFFLSQSLKQRTSKSHYICRARTGEFPPGSFIKVKSDLNIFLATPELCFLQAARQLPFIDLILLGFRLCAIYCEDSNSEYGQVNRTPITTPYLLNEYLDRADNFYGIKRARNAARYVLANSNSPVESRLSIIAELPFHLGGFAIPKPQLNYPVQLTESGANLLGVDEIKVDFAWPESMIAAEYDSNMCHLEPHQLTRDHNRQTALSQAGYKVIGITAGNMNFASSIENIMLIIRDSLGLRKETKQLKKYSYKRRALIRQLFF